MKLVDYATKCGVSYLTAYRWWKAGHLKGFQMPTGTIIIEELEDKIPLGNEAWIYCRVSSHDKKDDLARQADRVSEFCRANGWTVVKVVKEIASGMSDNRPKLIRLLESDASRIVVEHKDRLTRFGFNYIETLIRQQGRELIVVHRDLEEEGDLLKDLVAIITSFCCRLYGLRRGRNKAREIRETVLCDEPSKSA